MERILLDLDLHGGVDPLSFFPLFSDDLAEDRAPKLSRVFGGRFSLKLALC